MSHSIPVGAVLNEAFQFGLQRWGTVIRLAWAPVLISLLLMAGFFGLAFNVEAMTQASAENFSSVKDYLRLPVSVIVGLGLLLYVLVALLYAGFMASIFRLVALGEHQPGFFTVRLDGPASRVFWALIITGLISTAIWIVAFAVALPLTGNSVGAFFGEMGAFIAAMLAAAETGSDEAAAAQAAGVFNYWKTFLYTFAIAFIPLLYINVRLAPFIPGSAAENRLLLMGSFNLTRGQFWPVLAAMFLMGVVVIVISIVFDLVSSLLEILMGLGQAGGAFAIIAGVIGILYFAMMVFYYAVIYGAQLAFSAIIYRRLKTGE